MSPTSTATCAFRPAPDEVHVWRVRLDVPAETVDRLHATLSRGERSRSARFRFDRDRRRFVVVHGALRDLLGRCLGTHARRVRFARGAFGKPQLGPEFGGQVTFNLSHSAELAVIAVATGAEVGVDLERIRAQADHADVARYFFSTAEIEQLNGLPGHLRARAFLACWTKKEAYVKARGEGLAIPLASFSVPLTTAPSHAPVDLQRTSAVIAADRHWSLHTLEPAPGFVGALAIEGIGWRLTEREWQAGSTRISADRLEPRPPVPRAPW